MALFSRGFILLWQGQLVSQLGNQAFLIAATYFVLDKTGSTTLVGTVLMASAVPLAVLGPLGGMIADRHSRRAILIVTDLLRGVAMGGLGLLLLWRPGAETVHLPLIVVVAAFNGIMAALFTCAVQAIIPRFRAERSPRGGQFGKPAFKPSGDPGASSISSLAPHGCFCSMRSALDMRR
jgi:MFS transporter, DHA3 family, macrolide efflux protein